MSADLVVLEAERRGASLYRFNTEDYPTRVRLALRPLHPKETRLMTDTEEIELGAARGIWLRRPRWPVVDGSLDSQTRVFAQQEAVAAIGGTWRALADRCVSPADAMQGARWKLSQLTMASRLGWSVPETLVTNDPAEASEFLAAGPTVAKAVAEARVDTGEGAWTGETFEIVDFVPPAAIRRSPVVLQRRVAKVADIRVTVIGRRVFAVRIEVPDGSPLDFRRVDPAECRYDVIELQPSTVERLQRYLDHFGLRFGAFDLAEDAEGTRWFLECNPAGQWGWLEPPTGLNMTAALLDLLLEPLAQ